MSLNRDGGRTVELYLPFEGPKGRVEAIVFGPVTLGHQLDWRDGKYRTALHLMARLASVDEATLRLIRFPDMERVNASFYEMLPADIQQNIMDGTIPLPRVQVGEAEEEAAPEFDQEAALAFHADAMRKNAASRAVGSFNPSDPWGNIKARDPETPGEEGGIDLEP
jgi:hypothetical protein